MRGPWRLIATALMLIIVVHAAAPVAQPLDRTAGSAFSAASADVTLTCSERVTIASTALPDDVSRPFEASSQALSTRTFFTCPPHQVGFDATGPPPAQTSFHPLNPRAPPAA